MSAGVAERAVSPWTLRWRRFRGHRTGMISLVILALLLVFVLAAGPVAHWLGVDPYETDLLSQYGPPSPQHPLGTDDAGRDELVRLMLGGQISLLVGLLSTAVGSLIGLFVGVVAGYFGGRTDSLLMRFTDGVIALPLLPLLIVLGALDLTKLGFSAEFAHSSAAGFWRALRERDYVRSARASGGGAAYVMTTHILPNVATPLIVAVTLTVGRVILFESVLSFLGFGIVVPTPSWGNMLNNAQELVTTAPALAIYPGLLIFVTVIAVNFLGDGLQHAFDPRSER